MSVYNLKHMRARFSPGPFTHTPYILIDIDVLVGGGLLRRTKVNIPQITVVTSLTDRYNYNLAVVSTSPRKEAVLKSFCEAYRIGVQRWIGDKEEVRLLDRAGAVHGAVLGPKWKFDTINPRFVFFYENRVEMEKALLQLQGSIL